MLVIRDEQRIELGKYSKENLIEWFLCHLRAMFKEKLEDKSDEEVKEFIRTGIDNAEIHDITIEYDVSRFLEFMVIFGEDFDVDDKTFWAGNILDKKNLNGTEKIDELDAYVNSVAFSS